MKRRGSDKLSSPQRRAIRLTKDSCFTDKEDGQRVGSFELENGSEEGKIERALHFCSLFPTLRDILISFISLCNSFFQDLANSFMLSLPSLPWCLQPTLSFLTHPLCILNDVFPSFSSSGIGRAHPVC